MKSSPNIVLRATLPWPPNKPRRTDGWKNSLFRSDGFEPTLDVAMRRILSQVKAFTRTGHDWRTDEITICSCWPVRKAGLGYLSERPKTCDPGVVVSFDLDGKMYSIACDTFGSISGNMCAIAAYIEGLRAQERYGVASLGEMLAGHSALPARSHWSEILGVPPPPPAKRSTGPIARLPSGSTPTREGITTPWPASTALTKRPKRRPPHDRLPGPRRLLAR